MAIKKTQVNWRVEVNPFSASYRLPADRRDCEEIATQIKRHVDGVSRDGVSVISDTEKTCEFCGNQWTEDSQIYNGGCCDKDQEAAPPEEPVVRPPPPQGSL